MALHECKCAFSVLQEYFGPVANTICEELRWGPKTMIELVKNTKLSLLTVKQALRVLINFHLVEFKALGSSGCQYLLLTENILLLSKYPRFLLTIRKKYGKEAEFIVKELLLKSRTTLYSLIVKVTRNLSQAHSQIPYSLSTMKNSVCELIENDYIIPVGRCTDDNVPVIIKLTEEEKIPIIDMQKLSNLYEGPESALPKNELLWTVNFDRFLVDYRDEIMVDAMTRRIDANAGVLMRHLLKLSFAKTDPWRPVSNPIPMMMIRDSIGNDVNASADVVKYTDQYIRVMEEDSSGIIGRSGEHSGAVLICFKDFFENLAVSCVSHVVEQKFGSKTARVFRLVQTKKFIEIEEIQRVAMLADKEAKHITYRLLEENFIQMHELRKPVAKTSFGPNKAFFLFYVDMNLIVSKVIGICHKAAYSISLKRNDERDKHIHLIDKKMQADVVKVMMTNQGTSDEQITEAMNAFLSPPEKALLETLRKIDRKLFFGETQIDETIFLLQCFITYKKVPVSETKLKKKK